MYQSLYRQYRPRSFADMVGQDSIVKTLRNQAASGHVAHAYLFCGSRGTGKTSAARIMSMAINCLEPREGDPCLSCQACTSIQNDTTLDVFEMDAASNSRVEEIREMLEKVQYPPQFVKYKVYIIDEVHMLSNAAFNALLKTLEEPPSYMVFILATTEPQKLPATILSRCQRFDFGRIKEEDIIRRLKQALTKHKAEDAALSLIATCAEGSMRDAWSLLDMCLDPDVDLSEQRVRDAVGAVSRDFLFSFLDALRDRNASLSLQMIDQLMQSGRDVQVFFRDFSRHLREVVAAALGALPTKESTDAHQGRLRAQAKTFTPAWLTFLLSLCMQAESDTRWISSPRTTLTVFALRACQMQEESDPTALLARISKLEEELSALKQGALLQSSQTVSHSAPQEQQVIPQKTEPLKAKESIAENKPTKKTIDVAPPPLKAEGKVPPVKKIDATEWKQPIETEALKDTPEIASKEKPQEDGRKTPVASEENPLEEPQKTPIAAKGPQEEAPIAKPNTSSISKSNPAQARTPEEVWNTMLKRAKRELTTIYSILQQGHYGGFQNDCFRLVYDEKEAFFVNFMNEPARILAIGRLLTEEMGHKVRFEAARRDRTQEHLDHAQLVKQDIEMLSQMVGRENLIVMEE